MDDPGLNVFSDLPEVPPGAPVAISYFVFGLSVVKFLGNATPFVVKLLREWRGLRVIDEEPDA